MELNDLRILLMLVALAAFLGVALWAYAPRHRGHFERIGRHILDEGEPAGQDRANIHNKEGSRA